MPTATKHKTADIKLSPDDVTVYNMRGPFRHVVGYAFRVHNTDTIVAYMKSGHGVKTWSCNGAAVVMKPQNPQVGATFLADSEVGQLLLAEMNKRTRKAKGGVMR